MWGDMGEIWGRYGGDVGELRHLPAGHAQQSGVGGGERRRRVELLGGAREGLPLHREQRALRLGARQPRAAEQRVHALRG